MLAVGMLIVVISVMSGFDRELRDKILGFNAHLKVLQYDGPLRHHETLLARLTNHAEVKGAAPFVLGQVLVETQPEQGSPLVSAPWVRGVDTLLESNVSVLPRSVIRGQFNLEGRSIVIGCELAASLGVKVGDRLAVYSPRNLQKMKASRGKEDETAVLPDDYKITGIFDVGHFEYNASIVVTSLENAQDLYDLGDSVHGLLVMLKDPYRAEQVRLELRDRLPAGLRIQTWAEDNAGILNALAVEKQAMFVVLFVVMIVAAFGITGTQIAFVVQKTREVGILKAIGAYNGQVAWLFFSQSLMVGLLGVAAGLAFGFALLSWRNEFLHFMNQLTGLDLFPASIYTFHELPALTLPWDVALICGSAMVLCVLAGVLPAWRAARLHPVEALRYE